MNSEIMLAQLLNQSPYNSGRLICNFSLQCASELAAGLAAMCWLQRFKSSLQTKARFSNFYLAKSNTEKSSDS